MPVLAFIAAIAIHIGLFSLIHKGGSDGDGGAGKKQEAIKVKILDKPSEIIVKSKLVLPTNGNVHKPKEKEVPPEQKVVEHKCDESYDGIGIQFDYMSTQMCKIAYVAKGYPADRAGILVGDLLLSDSKSDVDCPGRGKAGSMLTIQLIRNGQHLTKTMVREKICTSPEKK